MLLSSSFLVSQWLPFPPSLIRYDWQVKPLTTKLTVVTWRAHDIALIPLIPQVCHDTLIHFLASSLLIHFTRVPCNFLSTCALFELLNAVLKIQLDLKFAFWERHHLEPPHTCILRCFFPTDSCPRKRQYC